MKPPSASLAWCFMMSTGNGLLTMADVKRRGLPMPGELLDALREATEALQSVNDGRGVHTSVIVRCRELLARVAAAESTHE